MCVYVANVALVMVTYLWSFTHDHILVVTYDTRGEVSVYIVSCVVITEQLIIRHLGLVYMEIG